MSNTKPTDDEFLSYVEVCQRMRSPDLGLLYASAMDTLSRDHWKLWIMRRVIEQQPLRQQQNTLHWARLYHRKVKYDG